MHIKENNLRALVRKVILESAAEKNLKSFSSLISSWKKKGGDASSKEYSDLEKFFDIGNSEGDSEEFSYIDKLLKQKNKDTIELIRFMDMSGNLDNLPEKYNHWRKYTQEENMKGVSSIGKGKELQKKSSSSASKRKKDFDEKKTKDKNKRKNSKCQIFLDKMENNDPELSKMSSVEIERKRAVLCNDEEALKMAGLEYVKLSKIFKEDSMIYKAIPKEIIESSLIMRNGDIEDAKFIFEYLSGNIVQKNIIDDYKVRTRLGMLCGKFFNDTSLPAKMIFVLGSWDMLCFILRPVNLAVKNIFRNDFPEAYDEIMKFAVKSVKYLSKYDYWMKKTGAKEEFNSFLDYCVRFSDGGTLEIIKHIMQFLFGESFKTIEIDGVKIVLDPKNIENSRKFLSVLFVNVCSHIYEKIKPFSGTNITGITKPGAEGGKLKTIKNDPYLLKQQEKAKDAAYSEYLKLKDNLDKKYDGAGTKAINTLNSIFSGV